MEEFDITRIEEQIENLSLKEKVSFLNEEIQRVQELIEELEDYEIDVDNLLTDLGDEYRKTLRNNVLKIMHSKELNVLEINERLEFMLGDLFISIYPSLNIELMWGSIWISYRSPYPISKERRKAYAELLNVLLADYENFTDLDYRRENLSCKDFEREVVSVIERLMEAKDKFEEIKNTIE